MRLTAFLLLVVCMHVTAGGYAQTVTLSRKNASLVDVFREIQKQTGYNFLYTYEELERAGNIDVDLKAATVQEAVGFCLANKPLTYAIVAKTIVIKPKRVVPQSIVPALPPPPIEIRGHVTDTAGNPLAGASVTVKGSKQAVSTDDKGNFRLSVAGGNATLVVSYIGYESRAVEWNSKVTYSLGIVLKHNDNPLDAVQVVAYGTETRRFSVGSVSTVTADQIEKQPVNNVLLALEGLVPGVTVTPASGAPGAPVQIQVRGQNTVKSNAASSLSPFDQPLFIVDGVPFAPQNNNVNQLTSIGGGISPFNSINPLDIESVSFLKDADATSIYGSQGANGVVLITTKKGKAGRTQLNISTYSGPNKVTQHTQMMNTPQYLALRREALQNDGVTLTAANSAQYPDLTLFDTTRYTNWINQFFGGNTANTNLHVNVSGGSATTTFTLSAGYSHSPFNIPGGFASDALTYHSGLHHNSVDRRLNIDITSDISYSVSNNAGSPSVNSAFLLPPDAPAMLDAGGNLVWSYKGVDVSTFQQYAYLKQKYKAQTYSFNNSLSIGYQLLPSLNIHAIVGYSENRTVESSITPLSSLSPLNPNSQNKANFGNNDFQTINIEPQIDYKRTIGKNLISATVGGTYKIAPGTNDLLSGSNYPTDALLNSIAGAATTYASNASSIYKYDGAFGSVRYIYDQKYLFHLTGRRDGSSNFGPGRQFGDFGSAGAGWIFSEERGFRKWLPFVSYGKLAGNYGTSGGDNVQPYQYLPLWKPIPYTTDVQGTLPYQPLNLFNPDFSWDTKKALNVSLDLGFLHDRLLVGASWYRNRVGNQLQNAQLPAQTGFTSVLENFPAVVQNSGLELTINTTNVTTKAFTWKTDFVISGNRNKLIAFPGLASSPYANAYTLGQPVSTLHGLKYAGINDTTGVFQFYTAKGQRTSTPNTAPITQGGDYQNIGNLLPKYFGSLGNTFSYKGIGLYVVFQFSKGPGYNYLHSIYNNAAIPGTENNEPELVEDHWRKPGDHSALQRVTAGGGVSGAYETGQYFAISDGSISDASYIRLKTLSLTYSLPSSYLKKVGIKGCSLYINAQNLLTITGYKAGDPEMQNLFVFPMQRTVVGGISLNL